jgi:ligand-binding sensor domain-containing protein
MKYLLYIIIVFITPAIWSQIDFSDKWEDHFSYYFIRDFHEDDTQIIALTDNAVFIYDKLSQETEKISSVDGLSGNTTSAMYYDDITERIIVGYENGLLEIIEPDRSVHVKPDLQNFSIIGSKRINHIASSGDGLLLLSTSFGIIGFDVNQLEYKDTYFIGNQSTEIAVHETLVWNDVIYAVTENGLFTANITDPFLVDYQNWAQYFFQSYEQVCVYQDQIYLGRNNNVYRLNNDNSLSYVINMPSNLKDLKSYDSYLTISSERDVRIYENGFNLIGQTHADTTDEHYYKASTALYNGEELWIGTEEFGLLSSQLSDFENFEEVHPQGPLLNEPFSIAVLNENLWVVYGSHDLAYTPLGQKKGISHFNGSDWINTPYNIDTGIPYRDLVHVNIDPFHENRVYVSSWGHGMLVIENDEIVAKWNHQNSGLETLFLPPNPNYVSIRIGSSVFDEYGSLWVANSWVENRIKKYANGQWTSYNIDELINSVAYGLNEIVIDQTGNKWIGSRDQGALVVNENVSKKMSLISDTNKGNLPSARVNAIAVDKNNKVWIGTRSGLRVFNSSTNIFDLENYQADVVAIAYGQDDGYGEALLGNQNINTICVDGADNKWFGTDSGGVLCTNSSGQETLYSFNTNNSPLPSNRILKIVFDDSTGKVYFATDKGVVSFDSNISPYGEGLQKVYAYPNPVTKNHETVTIDGRNGTHLPNGTNVKILDASGALVYETNVEEGQEAYGGKVVWDKRNLAGKKVASGVYIVLLSNDDAQETAIAKIAIVN